eukprot:13654561-Alexandrium_andersonii.AAC.1
MLGARPQRRGATRASQPEGRQLMTCVPSARTARRARRAGPSSAVPPWRRRTSRSFAPRVAPRWTWPE